MEELKFEELELEELGGNRMREIRDKVGGGGGGAVASGFYWQSRFTPVLSLKIL